MGAERDIARQLIAPSEETDMTQLSTPTITIRPAYADDDAALERLAVLDSAESVPPRPLMLAEVDGEPRAALSLHDGSVIANPFFPTADLVVLLRGHAARTAKTATSRRRRRHLRLGLQHG
jgi:hypothetical protein